MESIYQKGLSAKLAWILEKPAERNYEFPSWSWVGWHLPCQVSWATRWGHDGQFQPMILPVLKNQQSLAAYDSLPPHSYPTTDLSTHFLDIEALIVKIQFIYDPPLQITRRVPVTFFNAMAGPQPRYYARISDQSESRAFSLTKKVPKDSAFHKRLTSQTWDGILVGEYIMVVDLVGDAYERVGLVECISRGLKFQSLEQRRIRLK